MLQLFLPVSILEITYRLRLPFFCKLQLHFFILHSDRRHRFETCFLVKICKFVNPDKVESIQQPAASRVSGMVGVGELTIINNYTRGAVCRNVVVSAVHY